MYATLYGQRTEVEPEERHFHCDPEGIWHLRKSALPVNEIMGAFDSLNLKCLQLLFDSPEQFWDALEPSNFNIIHAGLDPEALSNRDEFTRDLNEMKNPIEKKLIYYYSVRHYNHVSQNIINHIIISLGDAYALLSEPNLYENISLSAQAYGAGESYRNTVSPSGHRIWANVNFCIEKTVSLLDFTAKYISELSHIKPGVIPKKPKALHVTFGSWKNAKLAKDTSLSTMSDELRLILALRDETVHNGTIDHFSRVYEHVFGSEVKGRFILLPDHEKGRILTAAGRKRFFSQDNHLNIILPTILDRVFCDLLSSLSEINHRIKPQWENPESYFERHSEVWEAIDMATKTGAFMKFDPSDD